MKPNELFTKNVRDIIKSRGLNLDDVCEAINIKPHYLKNYRKRSDAIRTNECIGFASILNVPIDELYKADIDAQYFGNNNVIKREKKEPVEIIDTPINPKLCEKCQYRAAGFGNCDYMLIEGHSRPSTDMAHKGKNKKYTYNHCPERVVGKQITLAPLVKSEEGDE